MPKINIKSTTATSANETFIKVKNFLTMSDDLKKIDPNLQINFNESQKTGIAKGHVFSAIIAVTENSPGSEVSLTLDLPMKFALMKGLIKNTLEKKLSQALG